MRTAKPLRTIVASCATAAVALAAAGCSAGPSTQPPPTTAPRQATTSAPTSTVSATRLPDVCTLLPSSTVGALIGTRVTASPSTYTEGNTHKPTANCSYGFGLGNAVNVNLTPGATAQDFHADAYAAGLSPTPIRGIGSEATTDETVGLHVLSGTDLINVQGTPQQSKGNFSQEIQIAKDLIAALAH
jgi:hypothetical protein